jgi:hypothetical protein
MVSGCSAIADPGTKETRNKKPETRNFREAVNGYL